MIYRVDTYEVDQPGWLNNDYIADYAYNYLSQYISGLSHETLHGTDIDFWGLFTLEIPNSSYTGGMRMSVPDGSSATFTGNSRTGHNRPIRHTLIYDEGKFLYYSLRDRDYGGMFTLIWIKGETSDFVGVNNHNATWTSNDLYGTDMEIYSLADLTAKYSMPQMFNFFAPPGKLVIAQMQPIGIDGVSSFFYTYLYTCSTVPFRSSVSIMGDNFLALNTNTLVRLSED